MIVTKDDQDNDDRRDYDDDYDGGDDAFFFVEIRHGVNSASNYLVIYSMVDIDYGVVWII